MKIKPIIAGNWKMHKTLTDGISFVGKIRNRILDKEKVKVIFCPPFNSLFSIVDALDGTSFGVGAQNAHHESQGAFTGEISVEMLKSMRVQYVIIGHSERRHIFGETDGWINQKIHAVFNGELIPIFCIGETLEDRQMNRTNEILHHQLKLGLEGVETIDSERLIIAYEPVWAIGTGKIPKINEILIVIDQIHKILKLKYKMLDNEGFKILYGGSIVPENSKIILSSKDIDGALVGGSSLIINDFKKIVNFNEN